MQHTFSNRTIAGQCLAQALSTYKDTPGLLVLGIPRGGLPVAFEVAQALHAPLDVFVVRKLGVPSDPEIAMGAIASGGVTILNDDVLTSLAIQPAVIKQVAQKELGELNRRETTYRGAQTMPVVRGKTVILVDDGIATGATTKAAVRALRCLKPKRLILAVPTSSQSAFQAIKPLVDEFIALSLPEPFHAVAQSYDQFPQETDEGVLRLLKLARKFKKKTD
jgi:putative phosphoribosyl transferase